jgi:hypothetical protein
MRNKKLFAKKKPESKEVALIDARRYLTNAKETITKSGIEYNQYLDPKYVHEASGIAYIAALKALDGWLVDKNLWTKENTKSIEQYQDLIHHHPRYKQLNAYLNAVYEDLHLAGYYGGATNSVIIKDGFQNVKNIIELIENN